MILIKTRAFGLFCLWIKIYYIGYIAYSRYSLWIRLLLIYHEIITYRKIRDLQSNDINLIRDYHQQISMMQTVQH